MVKNLPANAGDMGSIRGLGRSSGGEHGNPLQYSCLEHPMDRGAWWATVHGVAESDMTEATQHTHARCFKAVLVVKNLPASPGDMRDGAQS